MAAREEAWLRGMVWLLGGVWLISTVACQATGRSEEYERRALERSLIDDLCAPGGYYTECAWRDQDRCREEFPWYTQTCLPNVRYDPTWSPTMRVAMEDCIFRLHFLLHLNLPVGEDRCLDASRWQLPHGAQDTLDLLRQNWAERRAKRRAREERERLSDDAAAPAP